MYECHKAVRLWHSYIHDNTAREKEIDKVHAVEARVIMYMCMHMYLKQNVFILNK